MLKVIYAGSPYASSLTLKKILEVQQKNNFKVVGILTNPPSAKGRHKELIATEVGLTTQEWNKNNNEQIAIFTPEHLDESCRNQIASLNADLLVCFAYGHIFGPKFLSLFKTGAINLHPSLLPKYRGATPVNSAILNMDEETGFSIQEISLACDEGNLLCVQKRTLDKTETAESLLNEFAISGADALIEILSQTARDNQLPPSKAQTGQASYCQMIKKEDGKINWTSSAMEIDAKIRAYTPWPSSYTDFNGQTLKIIKATTAQKLGINDKELLKDCVPPVGKNTFTPGTFIGMNKKYGVLIACTEGILVAQELQLQGKKTMLYKDFMNGVRNISGTVLQ